LNFKIDFAFFFYKTQIKMAFTQQLTNVSKDTIMLINDIIYEISNKNKTECNNLWTKISEVPYVELKKQCKKKVSKKKTAYYMFSTDKTVRENIIDIYKIENDNNKPSIGVISKLMSEKYKTLSEEEKKVYQDKADEVNKTLTNNKITKNKIKKKTGYMLFISDPNNRNPIKLEYPDYTMIEVNGILIQKWKALSDEEKSVFNNKAKEEFELNILQNKKDDDVDKKDDDVDKKDDDDVDKKDDDVDKKDDDVDKKDDDDVNVKEKADNTSGNENKKKKKKTIKK